MIKEDKIRRKLLEMDILEAVIDFGQNPFTAPAWPPAF